MLAYVAYLLLASVGPVGPVVMLYYLPNTLTYASALGGDSKQCGGESVMCMHVGKSWFRGPRVQICQNV